MRDHSLIGPWVRRFLLEHLVTDRNLAYNTQVSYRDTLLLLLPFLSQAQKKAVDRLTIDDLSPSRVRSFLRYVEKEALLTFMWVDFRGSDASPGAAFLSRG